MDHNEALDQHGNDDDGCDHEPGLEACALGDGPGVCAVDALVFYFEA